MDLANGGIEARRFGVYCVSPDYHSWREGAIFWGLQTKSL